MTKKVLTLLIIHKADKILLGMKKRGFGVGKWNGFGGKVEVGETIEEAAKREVFEEVGVTVNVIEKLGVLDFSWKGKEQDILEVNIFKATDFSGQPSESEEMKPQWFNVKEIPYEKMWVDDKYWMPLFLDNKKFNGNFMFDEDNNVLKHTLHEI
jgi:8-oxo-dGTP diphosphatase/2-hydroxy-dATP diphosphatase